MNSDADQRRTRLRRVAQSAGLELQPHPDVAIDYSNLAKISQLISGQGGTEFPPPAAWDDRRFWLSEVSAASRSQYLAVGNAVNFRFWRSDGVKVEGLGGSLGDEFFTGSMYLWRRLRLAYDRNEFPLLDARFLAHIDMQAATDLFSDDHGFNPLSEGLVDRVENLRDLGRTLLASWGGSFWNLCQACGGSLPRFILASRQIRAFDDPVGKLALLNAIMHQGSGLVRFEDPLLPAVDYHVLKQLLRQGVLRPGPVVLRKLEAGSLLDPNEALDLRVAALESLVEMCATSGVSGDRIDNLYWFNRSTCSDVDPACGVCVFQLSCRKVTTIGRPQELTRHY